MNTSPIAMLLALCLLAVACGTAPSDEDGWDIAGAECQADYCTTNAGAECSTVLCCNDGKLVEVYRDCTDNRRGLK